MIGRIKTQLDQFFFVPDSKNFIGIIRVVTMSYLLFIRIPKKEGQLRWAVNQPHELLTSNPIFDISPVPYPLSEFQIHFYIMLMTILCALSLAGILTRFSLFFFSTLYFTFAAGMSSWGLVNHHSVLIAYVLIILIFAPGSDAWSIDRLIFHFWQKGTISGRNFFTVLKGPARIRWGIQAILITLSLIYFSAGTAKLRHGGLQWMNGNTLKYYLSTKSKPPRSPLAASKPAAPEQAWKDGFGLEFIIMGRPRTHDPWFHQYQIIYIMLSVFAVGVELCAPLMLIGGWFRNSILILALVFHLGIAILLYLPFVFYIIMDLLLLDWSLIFGTFNRRFLQGRGEFSKNFV